MITLKVLAEYRAPRHVVLLEQIKSEWERPYRLTICLRFPSMEEALGRFFKEVPKRDHGKFADLKGKGRS